MPSRKAICNSFIVSNFNYYPLIYYFTSRESINKMHKIQEQALRFVFKDSLSDYDTLLFKCGNDSFRISSLKSMAVEIYKILNDMSPEYLSFFSKSSIPYSLRDNNKLMQQNMRTTTFGIKSFSNYGAHLWNSLPVDIINTVTLGNFKTLKELVGSLMPLLSMSTYDLNLNVYCRCIDFHRCFHVIFQYTLDISRLPYRRAANPQKVLYLSSLMHPPPLHT